jgi:hypothetical protein
MKRIALCLFALLVGSPVFAGEVSLTVTEPDLSTCVDGSAAATNCPITGVEIQWKVDSGAWSVKETWPASITTTTITKKYTGVALGKTYCYRARNVIAAAVTLGSDLTVEACKSLPFISPRAPLGVTADATITLNIATTTTVTPQ